MINGIRSVIGDKPKFLGCTTTGLVTNHFLSYTGALAGGAFISCDTLFFEIFYEENIKDKEFEAGRSLAKQMRDANTPDDASLILFYDSIKVTSTEGQPALSVATTILEGFHSHYNHWPTVADNAFYSMNEKKKKLGEGYEPKVSVSTKELEGKIQIKIKGQWEWYPAKSIG